MNINDYLLDQTGLDWAELLKEWHWLLPPQYRIWLATRCGDLFLEVPDGSIHMLDVGAGTLGQVAAACDEFLARLDYPPSADEYLLTGVVDALVGSGAALGPGQCYSFRQLPTLGGSYREDNRMVFPIREHFGAWGSVQRQLSTLPDGTEIQFKIKN